MPRASGLDVFRYARARWPSLPAFLVTGGASRELSEEARRLDVERIEKRFDPMVYADSSRLHSPLRTSPRFRRPSLLSDSQPERALRSAWSL